MYSSTRSLTSALNVGRLSTPRPGCFTPAKDPVRAPGPVWTGPENLASTGIRSSDRPARSESLYRLCCPGMARGSEVILSLKVVNMLITKDAETLWYLFNSRNCQ